MRMVSAASLEVATKHKVPRLALGRFAPARGARDDKGVEKTNDKVLRGWSAVLHSAVFAESVKWGNSVCEKQRIYRMNIEDSRW